MKHVTQRRESSDPFITLKALTTLADERGSQVMPMTREINADAVQVDSLLTRSEVARILGVSPTTVTRWAREGRLACRVTLGGHHRFARTLIEDVQNKMLRGVPFDAPVAPRKEK